jgi:hypothetical protein
LTVFRAKSGLVTFHSQEQEVPMSIKHANPSEVIHLQPLGSEIGNTKTSTLFKTEVMEAIRLVLPAGKQIAEHKAPGEITVFCLEGRVKFTSQGVAKELVAGDMLYLWLKLPAALNACSIGLWLVCSFFWQCSVLLCLESQPRHSCCLCATFCYASHQQCTRRRWRGRWSVGHSEIGEIKAEYAGA